MADQKLNNFHICYLSKISANGTLVQGSGVLGPHKQEESGASKARMHVPTTVFSALVLFSFFHSVFFLSCQGHHLRQKFSIGMVYQRVHILLNLRTNTICWICGHSPIVKIYRFAICGHHNAFLVICRDAVCGFAESNRSLQTTSANPYLYNFLLTNTGVLKCSNSNLFEINSCKSDDF
jgi:hypothetical protein